MGWLRKWLSRSVCLFVTQVASYSLLLWSPLPTVVCLSVCCVRTFTNSKSCRRTLIWFIKYVSHIATVLPEAHFVKCTNRNRCCPVYRSWAVFCCCWACCWHDFPSYVITVTERDAVNDRPTDIAVESAVWPVIRQYAAVIVVGSPVAVRRFSCSFRMIALLMYCQTCYLNFPVNEIAWL